jgi:hypothetical protein
VAVVVSVVERIVSQGETPVACNPSGPDVMRMLADDRSKENRVE